MDTDKFSCPLCLQAAALTGALMERAARFTIFDWAMLKACLVSLGTLFGIRFSKALRPFAPLVAFVFFATWLMTALRLFDDRQQD